MNKEQFEAHCAELEKHAEKNAELNQWKDAFKTLMYCYAAMAYKRKWKDYDSEFDYKYTAKEVIEEVGLGDIYVDIRGEIPRLEYLIDNEEE